MCLPHERAWQVLNHHQRRVVQVQPPQLRTDVWIGREEWRLCHPELHLCGCGVDPRPVDPLES